MIKLSPTTGLNLFKECPKSLKKIRKITLSKTMTKEQFQEQYSGGIRVGVNWPYFVFVDDVTVQEISLQLRDFSNFYTPWQ